MRLELRFVCLSFISVALAACGGLGNNKTMTNNYTTIDTSINIASFLQGTGVGTKYSNNFIGRNYSGGFSLSPDGAMVRYVDSDFVTGDLPFNSNLTTGSLVQQVPYLQRKNGNFVGRNPALRNDGILADGYLYQWTSPNIKPTNIVSPTYRTTIRNTDGNNRLEGAIPLELTQSDWLLVSNTYSYPTKFFRIKLGTDVIEPIGDPYTEDIRFGNQGETLLGEGGQVVVGTFTETRYYSTPARYEVISGATGAFRAITPAGFVVGNSYNATDLTNRGYWYWVPGGTVQEIKLAGKRDVQVMGCSADGTIVGYYFDEVLNREVAWVLTELGKQPTPLEDLIPGDEKIYRANAINWDGFILGLRRDSSNNLVSILIKPVQ